MSDVAVPSRRDLKETLLSPEMGAVFQALVPRHVTPERMLRLSIACATRTPRLLEVPQVQVIGALVQCAALGLEPNSSLQHVHLIPFKNNRTNRYELQLIIGYRGYIELGRRTGRQTWIHADVVRPGDEFSFAYGNDAHLRHKPGRGSAEREKPTDAYCFVQLVDGFAFVVLPEWEILRHREHSMAWKQQGERSPWGQHSDRMWRKTAIRVLYSGGEVPLDTELAMAVTTDDQRMDYRAMGELALKGGKGAVEHLKEGMDTFVAEHEAEPEPEERIVEMRSQVRRAAREPQGEPRADSGPEGPARRPAAAGEAPAASQGLTGRKRGRPSRAEVEARQAAAAAAAAQEDEGEGDDDGWPGPATEDDGEPLEAKGEPQAVGDEDESDDGFPAWRAEMEAKAAGTPPDLKPTRKNYWLNQGDVLWGQRGIDAVEQAFKR